MQRIFVDANVLASWTLHSWLFMLREASTAMFSLLTTEDVLAETLYTWRRRYPDADGSLITNFRSRFENAFDEIVHDFNGQVPYSGVDPHDRHVHAAAVASHADILLTCDEGLLHQPDADSLPYSPYHPDDFFVLMRQGRA